MKMKIKIAAAVVGVALGVVGSASAAKPPAYQGNAGGVQGSVQNGASAPVASAGTLPFTGLDLGLFAAGGGALIVAGYAVTRRGRRQTTS